MAVLLQASKQLSQYVHPIQGHYSLFVVELDLTEVQTIQGGPQQTVACLSRSLLFQTQANIGGGS